MPSATQHVSHCPRQKQDYKLEALDGELLLYHVGETRIMHFNPTAALVWQLCQGDRTVEGIARLLADAFPESRESVHEDVTAMLHRFEEAGCIEWI